MGIQIKRIGHVGLLVADFERSFQFYTEVLGCKVTNRNKRADGSETAFLRFDDMHHDFVIASAPQGVDVTAAGPRERLIQQIAFEVEDRDAFLKALAHLHAKGVKLINGPLIHGFEGGGNLGGSGSRSFYFQRIVTRTQSSERLLLASNEQNNGIGRQTFGPFEVRIA